MRSAFAVLLLLSTTMVRCQTPASTNPGAAQSPDTEHSVTDLAKETQNPVGDIVSVPFQFNFNSGGAYQDQTFFNLNFQPVIPIHLTHKLTYIIRTIVPVVSIPTGNGVSYSGVGDIQEQTFFTPARPGKVIWGIGPSFSFPTADRLPCQNRHVGDGPLCRVPGTARSLRCGFALRAAFTAARFRTALRG